MFSNGTLLAQWPCSTLRAAITRFTKLCISPRTIEPLYYISPSKCQQLPDEASSQLFQLSSQLWRWVKRKSQTIKSLGRYTI